MFNKGFTLVEVMIVVMVIALLAAGLIPVLVRARLSANDAIAKSALRHLSTASETFFTLNGGNYPSSEAVLTTATPPYIDRNYCDTTVSGFQYTCVFDTGAYAFTATPVKVLTTGTTTFSMSTGGLLSP